MPLCQRQEPCQIVAAGHRALRVRRRADIGDADAVQKRGRQTRIIGQKTGRGGGRHIDRLCPHGQGRHGIDLIERVRHQHRRRGARLAFGAKRDAGVEQPLARAVQVHDPIRADPDAVAAPQPAADAVQQRRRAVVGRVDAKAVKIGVQHLGQEIRRRVARLADGHRDGLTARGMRIQKLPQTRKRIIRQVRKPLWKRHCCLNSGSSRPVGCKS